MSIPVELPQTPEAKAKAVELALKNIEKAHGKGAVFNMAKRVGVSMPHIPTGVFAIDNELLGIGGFPRGRVVEIFGPESSGKTTIALQLIGAAQRQGELAAFVDAEHALDPNYAKKLGVDMNKLIVSQPDNGEQALEISEELISSNGIGVLVVDSVAALVPRAELDGDMGDSHVGLQARLMSQAMRKLTAITARSGCTVVFINQLREKIGVMFGSPETTTGGRALKFYASVRIDVRRIATIKDGDTPIGNRVKLKTAKNKVSAPFREVEVDLLFGRGFDGVGSLFDTAVEADVIKKNGAWFEYGGQKFQGREQAKMLLDDPAQYAAILEAVKKVKVEP